MQLGKKEARRLLLSRQGLLRKDQFGRGRNAVRKIIDRLSWVQIDTISVVERAHHHVLRTRVSNYDPQMLHQLQVGDRYLFEYWSHAAAYLPISDYRYYLPVMHGSAGKRVPDAKLAPEILRRIENEGPLQSRDFESPRGRNSKGWWDWKPAKVTLEYLYLAGELMVAHRDGFQKVYDLRERVLPDHVDTRMPTDIDWCEFIVNRMIGAHGLASEYDIGYARAAIRQLTNRNIKKLLRQALDNLLEDHQVCRLEIEGQPYFTHPDTLSELPLRLGRRLVHILSPFDNLTINRRRMLELFHFDYQLECYVPAPKRRYGYFCLPILYGDALVGRLDAKAERKINHLEVRNLVLEDKVKINDDLMVALKQGLLKFSKNNLCQSISVLQTTPTRLKKILNRALAT
ncbi:MAG: YcaQ family DNA glycosylase [Proteobacteria bacterium]|nr:YcaQ family DNA glycosylase [Pseudomonadota bacterium]